MKITNNELDDYKKDALGDLGPWDDPFFQEELVRLAKLGLIYETMSEVERTRARYGFEALYGTQTIKIEKDLG